MLKNVLVKTPILIRMNLIKPFILDVDWSIWIAGTIISQWKEK
jgi:hypothetical protein